MKRLQIYIEKHAEYTESIGTLIHFLFNEDRASITVRSDKLLVVKCKSTNDRPVKLHSKQLLELARTQFTFIDELKKESKLEVRHQKWTNYSKEEQEQSLTQQETNPYKKVAEKPNTAVETKTQEVEDGS